MRGGFDSHGGNQFKNMNRIKNYVNELYEAHIQMANAIRDIALEYDLINEQEFLNWQDELNNLSQLITK